MLKKINHLKNPTLKNKFLARKILYFFEHGMHIKHKIEFNELIKDKYASKIFKIALNAANNKESDYKDMINIFKNNLENSYFYSLVKKTI